MLDVNNIMNSLELKIWVVGCSVLAIKMWANTLIQGISRIKYNAFDIPEDASKLGAFYKKDLNYSQTKHFLDERGAACWRNDLENIPLFLFLSLAFVLINGSYQWLVCYFSIFIIARISHTVCYFMRAQPWRSFSFDLGFITTIILTIHNLCLVFS